LKEWLENKYNHYILKALKDLDSTIHEIHCSLSPNKEEQPSNTVKSLDGAKAFDAPAGFVRKKIIEQPSFGVTPHPVTVFHETNLNTRYTFENFIVAENNELARAACYAVSQNPAWLIIPFVMVGYLGKTLAQSVEMKLSSQRRKTHKYITSGRFTTELVSRTKN
jgi:chromosomal replication initiation ATPase DnaA